MDEQLERRRRQRQYQLTNRPTTPGTQYSVRNECITPRVVGLESWTWTSIVVIGGTSETVE